MAIVNTVQGRESTKDVVWTNECCDMAGNRPRRETSLVVDRRTALDREVRSVPPREQRRAGVQILEEGEPHEE